MEQRPQSIVDALKRPNEPWDVSRYISEKDIERETLADMTIEEMLAKPFECGMLTSQKSRAMALALGVTVETSQSENITFGFIPLHEGRTPIAIMTNTFGSAAYERANIALTHMLYLYMRATECSCCRTEDLLIPPQSVRVVSDKIQGRMIGNPHWWESTVWARAFHARNAIYMNHRLAAIVASEDQRQGFWFPDIDGIGKERRTEKMWKGEIEDRVLSALSGSPSRIWKE